MLRMALALALSTCMAMPLAAASVDDMPIKSSVMGEGETIIFIHGWTCDESSWDEQIAHFAQDYRVVTLDLPGHGISGQPVLEDFSLELFAEAVEAVRAEVGADKVVLVGHSMGGPVIRQYALDFPEHVAGLVAVDGPLDMRGLPAAPLTDFTPAAREQMIQLFFVPETSTQVRDQVLGMMLSASETTAEGAMTAMFAPDVDRESVVAAPALAVLAGNSFMSDDPAAREVAPDLEVTVMPGTGHFLMMEKPAEFNALLDTFLTERAEF